jgi:hypothetical protein
MLRLKALATRLAGLNLAHLLVLSLVVKALISDISIATFLLSIPILGFEAYKLYLKHKKPDPIVMNQEVMDRLDKLQAKVNANTFDKSLTSAATPAKRYF